MALLNVASTIDAVLLVNGRYAGEISAQNGVTIPINGAISVIAFPIAEKLPPTVSYIDSALKLRGGSGRLSRWSDEIFELDIIFAEAYKNSPPIIIREERWGNATAALCGDWFVVEKSNGSRLHFKRQITDFRLFGEYAALYFGETAIIVDKELNCVFPEVRLLNISVGGRTAELTFNLGDMDCCEIVRTVDIVSFETLNSSVRLDTPETEHSRLRLFCQALRLNLKNEAMRFASDDISFDEISEFLGVFDRVDNVKYQNAAPKNALALRYKIDDYNYQYSCYEFVLRDNLIYDIEQL